jgi:hypothetical protein
MMAHCLGAHMRFRNTIAGSPPGKRICIFFLKKGHISKIEFLNFHFLAKKNQYK